MKFSEALRCIIDFAVDHDAELGLPFLADREKSLRAELLTVQETMKSVEEQQKVATPKKVFEEVVSCSVNDKSGAARKWPFIDSRGQTEKDRFLKAASYVANEDKVVTPEMKKRFIVQATEHPEWLEEVPDEPQRRKLMAMLKAEPRTST
jgi:hypothetical protein